jgi:hypothetical protein
MSSFIGRVNGPRHNSPKRAAEVWCSLGGVELHAYVDRSQEEASAATATTLDPLGARVLAALLVEAAKETERMREQAEPRWQYPLPEMYDSNCTCDSGGGPAHRADCKTVQQKDPK